MNLHIFVAEPINPVLIFHDAHIVPFCLTADHIATCLCVSTPSSSQHSFGLLLPRGEWKVKYLDTWRRLCGGMFLTRVATSQLVEGFSHSWSTMRVSTRNDETVGGLSLTRGAPRESRQVKFLHFFWSMLVSVECHGHTGRQHSWSAMSATSLTRLVLHSC